jgi:hypothetical protein
MNFRVENVQSRIHATDSQRLLDPQVMAEIVRQCARAVREEMESEKRRSSDRKLKDGISPARY